MINLCTKLIVLSRDVIWTNKTYDKYISRQEHTKSDSYIIEDEGDSNNWAHKKIYPVKTEKFNIMQKFKTEQGYRVEEDIKDVHNITKKVYFKIN